MIRLLIRALLTLLANAAGLYVAALLLDDFNISGEGYVTAVIIFTVTTMVLSPFVASVALRSMPAIMGGTALVTTLVGLVLTDFLTDGLSISGVGTWILATLVVWLFSLLTAVILPLFLFKKALSDDKKTDHKEA
jgi:uncharacterized membrane protein YvlD (DUF360 family)